MSDKNFRVELEAFRGPLDLLVFLVKQDEIDIGGLSLSAVASQFIEHLQQRSTADLNEVGDFLESASLLLELKTGRVLPATEESQEPAIDVPRDELVQRLLEYKKYKDAAVILEEQSAAWRERYPRVADDFPARRVDPAEQPLHEIELWDLVSAMGRILRDNQPAASTSIIYDETPISVHMRRVCDCIAERGVSTFSELFSPGMHKSTMIGVFLAILELVRRKRVRTEQSSLHDEIRILPDVEFQAPWSDADQSSLDARPADAEG